MAQIPIDSMSLEEKLLAMEMIWDDLVERAGEFDSPDWHSTELAEREKRLSSGEESFEDWESAKARIKKDCS